MKTITKRLVTMAALALPLLVQTLAQTPPAVPPGGPTPPVQPGVQTPPPSVPPEQPGPSKDQSPLNDRTTPPPSGAAPGTKAKIHKQHPKTTKPRDEPPTKQPA